MKNKKTTLGSRSFSGIELDEFIIGEIKDEEREEISERIYKILDNIRRFDDKENGADYFSGWDDALDMVISDLKEGGILWNKD